MTRFLFGDVPVDCGFEVEKITLPTPVQQKLDEGHEVRASYHIECAIAIRGVDVPIHSRLANEGSAIFREYDELVGNNNVKKRVPMLCSIFLRSDPRARVKKEEEDPSLAFELTVAVKVPEYVIDRKFWRDTHFEGSDLLSQRIHIAATPPDPDADPPRKDWTVLYGFSETEDDLGVANQPAELTKVKDYRTFEIPLDTNKKRCPGIKGKLVFYARPHA